MCDVRRQGGGAGRRTRNANSNRSPSTLRAPRYFVFPSLTSPTVPVRALLPSLFRSTFSISARHHSHHHHHHRHHHHHLHLRHHHLHLHHHHCRHHHRYHLHPISPSWTSRRLSPSPSPTTSARVSLPRVQAPRVHLPPSRFFFPSVSLRFVKRFASRCRWVNTNGVRAIFAWGGRKEWSYSKSGTTSVPPFQLPPRPAHDTRPPRPLCSASASSSSRPQCKVSEARQPAI